MENGGEPPKLEGWVHYWYVLGFGGPDAESYIKVGPKDARVLQELETLRISNHGDPFYAKAKRILDAYVQRTPIRIQLGPAQNSLREVLTVDPI